MVEIVGLLPLKQYNSITVGSNTCLFLNQKIEKSIPPGFDNTENVLNSNHLYLKFQY